MSSSRTVYVGGIYRGKYTPPVEEKDIRDHLNAYGQLESVRMVPERACAYVTFATRRAAEKAVKELDHNLQIKGRQLKVIFGTPPAPELPIQHCVVDPPRTGAVIPSHDKSAVSGSGVGNEDLVGREESSFRLPHVGHCGDGTRASDGVSGNPSIGGEQVELRTVPLGAKRLPEEATSPREMRERKKGPSTSTPPVSPQPATPLGVGSSAAVEETPLTRFVTSSPRDFLPEGSTPCPDANSLPFPFPSDVEITEMTLKGVQTALMSRRRLLAQLRQQEVRAVAAEERAAAAEAQLAVAEARAAAAEARAATVEERAAAAAMEAQKGCEAFLMTVNALSFKK